MLPLLAQFTFVGLGLVSVVVLTALILRGPLTDRWGTRGYWAALAAGVLAGVLAAALGLVSWTGTWVITSYAVALLVAAVVARWLFVRACAQDAALRVAGARANDLAIVVLLAGLVGARARYVWENWGDFVINGSIDWRAIVDLDRGGMVWYGSLIGGVIAGVIWGWRLRIPLLPLTDAAAPAVAAGLAIGRIGCFFNGCCYGGTCNLPWAVTFPHLHEARHPTQLYESVVMGVMAVLLTIWHRRSPRPGTVTAAFLIGYGVWRYLNEILRVDYRHAGTLNDLGGWVLTNSQITSLWLIVAGCVLITWCKYRPAATAVSDSSPR